jgi:hypothetical protein
MNDFKNKKEGFFDEKKEWERKKLSRKLEKSSPVIPGTGGQTYRREELKKMVNELFPKDKFGNYISEKEVKQRLREMRKEIHKAGKEAEKKEVRRKKDFWKERTGIKDF